MTAFHHILARAGRTALAAAFALASTPLHAAPCGVVVLPPGLGIEDPTQVTGINPLIGSSLYNAQIENVIYRPLVWFDENHDPDPKLSIANRIEANADGTRYHVELGDWSWSDGQKITADDVLYCLELVRKMGKTWAGYGQADMPYIIKSFTVAGPRALDIELTRPVNPRNFVLNGLGSLWPLPRHAWGDTSVDEMWRRQTDLDFFKVVSGPYRVSRLEMARFLELTVNPAYSGEVKPQVEKVVVNFLSGVDELRALETGEVDAGNIPFPLWDAAAKLKGYQRIDLPLPYTFNNFIPNFRNPNTPFFRDVRVRQAMADALDQQGMIDLLYHGSAVAVHSPMPTEPASGLSPDARAGKFPVGYDVNRANALLDDAGWARGPDGVRQKDGVRMAFTTIVPAGRDVHALRAQIIQRDWARIGIEMHIVELQFSQMLPIIYGPDPTKWESVTLGWTLPAFPEGQTLFGTDGVNNNEGYSDPKMDELTARMNNEPGQANIDAYQDYAAAQQPVIFLPLARQVILAKPGIEGLPQMLTPLGFWAPEFLHLSGPMECDARDRHSS